MAKRILVLVAFGSAQAQQNPRPELPQCKCLKNWPYSDDPSMWAKSYGDASLGDLWELPAASADGCTMVSKDWPKDYGYAKDAYQFCVPDTSEGPCIGLGSISVYSMSFYMQCGQQGKVGATWDDPITADPTKPTPSMTADQKLAAMAYADAIGVAKQNPPCACDADWSSSNLSATYCGGNSSLAKGAVTSETCFNAPKDFSYILTNESKGAFNYGYYDKDQSPQQKKAVAKWCKVSSSNCAFQEGSVDECTGEKWMATHMINLTIDPSTNEISGESIEVPPGVKLPALEYTYGVHRAALMRSRQVLAGSADVGDFGGYVMLGVEKAVAMTFFPENVISYIGNTENLMEKAQVVAAETTQMYDKIDWINDYITKCNSTCKAKQAVDQAASQKAADDLKARLVKVCDDDPECKVKQDAAKCEAINAATAAMFPSPSPSPSPSTEAADNANGQAPALLLACALATMAALLFNPV